MQCSSDDDDESDEVMLSVFAHRLRHGPNTSELLDTQRQSVREYDHEI